MPQHNCLKPNGQTNSLHYPWQLGKLTFEHRLIQAPLAGISCSAFRRLFSQFCQPAYAVTEMLSSHSLINLPASYQHRYLHRCSTEQLLCFQLSGNNSEVLAHAAHKAEMLGADLIDLNFGCPKPKITNKGSGAALLETPERLLRLVTSVRQASFLPLTVKLRLPLHSSLPAYITMIRRLADAGVDGIIIHGRTADQHYDVPADYQQIAEVVAAVNLPVIANGDVDDLPSLSSCLSVTGATAVMIGRGSIGRPWLFHSLLQPSDIQSDQFASEQSLALACFVEHIQGLIELEGQEQRALLQARRLLKWYFPDLNKEVLALMFEQRTLNQLHLALSEVQC